MVEVVSIVRIAGGRGGMKRSVQTCIAVLCLALSAGCQCCFLSEPYFALIDEISDYELALDCLYHPELDPTRIGQRDWCRCPINRLICPCACRTGHCWLPTPDFCPPPDCMCVGPRGCMTNPYPEYAPHDYEGGTPAPYMAVGKCPVCGGRH